MAVSEQILCHEQSQAHSGRPAQQDVWHLMAVSRSQEQDDCTTKEIHATVASLPEWDEGSSEVTYEWKSIVHLQARSWEWADLQAKVTGALGKHDLGGEVDFRVKELRSSWWTRARRHRNKLFKSGHWTSRTSSRGGAKGKPWRGVVEVAAEVRLMILAHYRLLIYLRRLEEWQFGRFPRLWWKESRAYGRAEESSGTQEGAVTWHVIAGKMCRSHLAYKVKVHTRLAYWQIWKIEVVRRGPRTAIRRSARMSRVRSAWASSRAPLVGC